MSELHISTAVYSTHELAELAVDALQDAGLDMRSLSIVGRDYHTEERVVGYYNVGYCNVDDEMKAWGAHGAVWGGRWSSLFGSGLFFIPGLGPLILAGPIVSWLVGALKGAIVFGELSVFGSALVSVGIPKDSVVRYETALKADCFVVLVHGTPEQVARAAKLLESTGAKSVAVEG